MTLSNLFYLQKNGRATEEKADCGIPKYQKSVILFQEELRSITELLNQGIGTSLSESTDMINLNRLKM